MPLESGESNTREGFYRLVNAREDPATLAAAKAWLLSFSTLPLGEGPGVRGCDSPKTPARELNAQPLAFHAPLALLEGAWLQGIAQTANNQQPEVAALSAAYLALLGADESASPAYAYRGLLQQHGIALGKTTAWQFAQDPRIGEPALRFASLQLAIGHHAADFFPETLGFTLAYLHSDSTWRLPALPPQRRQEILATMALHAQTAQQAFCDPARLQHGYKLYQTAEAEYLAALQCQTDTTIADQVAAIFRRKRHYAQGYHAGVKIGGKNLEEWFSADSFDADGFLTAFAASPYVSGQPGQRLFDRLTAFGGPMFGVFDGEELALITTWLETRNQTDTVSKTASVSGNTWKFLPPFAKGGQEGLNPQSLGNSGKKFPLTAFLQRGGWLGQFIGNDKRQLFHQLIQYDPKPETLDIARNCVDKILSKSRRRISNEAQFNRQFFDYTPQDFAQRITQIHGQETAKHQPFQVPPKLHHEEYIWGICQFAPAILVDGCWLRHQGEAAQQDSRLHRLLQRIYAEELGEGRIDWNHPKIYRDLLNDLGIDLPSLETEAFAQHPSFLDSAFDLPSYLLAISQFPRSYLPETLGLNLAIELSGLGAGYMRLAEELRYWNINPLIIKLHLSIDNLAGGHAAMACEAIQLYLDEVRISGGDSAVQTAWRRVWSGYLSLDTASRRFKWMLVLAFCRRFIPRRLLNKVNPISQTKHQPSQ